MKVRFRLAVLLLAIAAALGVASPALAKGGGGTVTPGCASINSWTNTVEPLNGVPTVFMRIAVFNGCVDEGAGAGKLPAVTMTTTDTATGTWLGAGMYPANYGLNTYTFYASYVPVEQAAPRTLTVTVTRPNGALQDSRSMTLAQVMQSVQPAA